MKILNDTEHRIFLSAMSREKKICKEIDADNDGTATMLLPVCKSIERKVNNAVPMENIDKMITEIDNLQFIHTELEYNGAIKKVISKDDVLEIINKYCKENTDD